MITQQDEKANEHGSVVVPQQSFVHLKELRICIFRGVLGVHAHCIYVLTASQILVLWSWARIFCLQEVNTVQSGFKHLL